MWELDQKEGWVLKNWCLQTVMLEKTLESLLDSKIKPVHPKENQSWIFIRRIDAEAEAPILRPRKSPWCWTRFNAWEGDDRGWGGWMAALTLWTWVWVSSGSWWWTGKPGVLQSMGSQRVGHDWVTELNWQLSYWPVLPYLFNGRAVYAVPLVIKNKKQRWSDITLIFARVNFPSSS